MFELIYQYCTKNESSKKTTPSIELEQFVEFEDSDEPDINPILESLGASTIETAGGQYFILSKKNKIAVQCYLNFWAHLIQQCQREVLFDDYFLVQLLQWLMAFSQ